jgi:putative heme iron utilization protein
VRILRKKGERNMATTAMENTPGRLPAEAAAWAARKLLREARVGTLATATDGQPYAALVTPAAAPDVSPLVLLSALSEHTRHLRAEPRCALLVAGNPTEGNPQTAPRVTLTGLAEPAGDPVLKARFLAVHPYAALYADFGDFALWRLRPKGAMFVGGFATAIRLREHDLLPDPAAVAAIGAAEASILAHCNTDHADAVAAVARAAGGAEGDWRMVTVDADGCDLACGEKVLRVAWSAPVADASAIRTELVRLARAARAI